MPTLETVVNITSVPMGLPTTTVVLLEHSGARPVSTVTGQLMWSVDICQIIYLNKEREIYLVTN